MTKPVPTTAKTAWTAPKLAKLGTIGDVAGNKVQSADGSSVNLKS